MPRSNALFGFSTGALARSNFSRAIERLKSQSIRSVELSALRHAELAPLIEAIEKNDFNEQFEYISFHAPSWFDPEHEEEVISLLDRVLARKWNVIVHPDVIYTPSRWRHFGQFLLIENMDRRKPKGRTSRELHEIFNELPDAKLCLDVAHARNLDTTLSILDQIIVNYCDRIGEIHISELNSSCEHCPLSDAAVADFRSILGGIDKSIPVIIESLLSDIEDGFIQEEMERTRSVFNWQLE